MKRFNFWYIFAVLILLIGAVKLTSGFYVDYIWFDDLGYGQLFTTPIIAKLLIGVLSFIIFFLILFGMGFITFKTYQGANQEHPGFWRRVPSFFKKQQFDDGTIDISPTTNKKFVILIIFLVSLFLSLLLALQTVQSGWMQLLQFFNATPFGATDPIFNLDISFFVFKMPFYSFVLNSLTSWLTLILLAGIFFFTFSGLIRIKGNILKKGGLLIPRSIRRFWSVLIGVLFILFALQKIMSMFSVAYSQTGYVYGAGYTDIHVTIPLSIALALVALIASIASFIFFVKNDHRLITYPVAIYLLVGIAGTGIMGLVQYTVSNNEYVRENLILNGRSSTPAWLTALIT